MSGYISKVGKSSAVSKINETRQRYGLGVKTATETQTASAKNDMNDLIDWLNEARNTAPSRDANGRPLSKPEMPAKVTAGSNILQSQSSIYSELSSKAATLKNICTCYGNCTGTCAGRCTSCSGCTNCKGTLTKQGH